MKKTIFILLLIYNIFILTSCKTLTVAEFKNKHDWEETVCEFETVLNQNIYMRFYYNGIEYNASTGFSSVSQDVKYRIIFDKNNPEKNYIILLNKPVLDPYPDIIESKGYITYYSEMTNYIYVAYDTYLYSEKKKCEVLTMHKEMVDKKYLDDVKKYKNSKKEIVIDHYKIKKIMQTGLFYVFPKINFEETKKKYD